MSGYSKDEWVSAKNAAEQVAATLDDMGEFSEAAQLLDREFRKDGRKVSCATFQARTGEIRVLSPAEWRSEAVSASFELDFITIDPTSPLAGEFVLLKHLEEIEFIVCKLELDRFLVAHKGQEEKTPDSVKARLAPLRPQITAEWEAGDYDSPKWARGVLQERLQQGADGKSITESSPGRVTMKTIERQTRGWFPKTTRGTKPAEPGSVSGGQDDPTQR